MLCCHGFFHLVVVCLLIMGWLKQNPTWKCNQISYAKTLSREPLHKCRDILSVKREINISSFWHQSIIPSQLHFPCRAATLSRKFQINLTLHFHRKNSRFFCYSFKLIKITKATTSLAARAMMSAQETWFAHCASASTAAFAWRIVLYPSTLRNRFSPLCRSSSLFEFVIMIEASQP